jgi:hypothetical protein
MSTPDALRAAVGDEAVVDTVGLGDDHVVITPTRTIVYRAEGLLSDESVETFPHDAERISVTDGRRAATIELDYGIDGTRSVRVPSDGLGEVLERVLAAVLRTTGVIGDDETVRSLHRSDELTLVVTDARVLKHVGDPVWDDDHENVPYADVTGVDLEEGAVGGQIVIRTADRAHRVKVPSAAGRALRERLEDAVCAFHGVESTSALGPDEDATDDGTDGLAAVDRLGTLTDDGHPDGPDSAPGASRGPDATGAPRTESAADTAAPSSDTDAASPATDTNAAAPTDEATPGSTDDIATLAGRVAALESAVERQSEQLAEQRRALERLVDELRRER